MGVSTYTFKSVVFESVKNKKILRSLRMVQKSFVIGFENETFERVFFKSVEVVSVGSCKCPPPM